MNDVRRILLVGDAHGDLGFLRRACEYAVANDCDVLLQLGDLGIFWPGVVDLAKQLDKLLAATKPRLRFCFVDGNHEGWDTLAARRDTARRTSEGFLKVTRRIEWIDRGTRWTWNGVHFGALGGAYSVDSHRRIAASNWWPDLEEPDDTDVQRLAAGGPLDVLVAHDTLPEVPLTGMRIPAAAEQAALATRRRIRDATLACTPDLLVHGHWHQRHSHHVTLTTGDRSSHQVRVEGLAANIGVFHRAVAVLDLASSMPTMPAGPPVAR